MSIISKIVKSAVKLVKPMVRKSSKTNLPKEVFKPFFEQVGHVEVSLTDLNKINSVKKASTSPVMDFVKQAGHTEVSLADLNKINTIQSASSNPAIDFINQAGYTETSLLDLMKANKVRM